MKPYFQDDRAGLTLYNGDALEVLLSLNANSVDAVVTDPPYGLSFMGKDWDHGIPGVLFWREALRVAKPGAHLLAFGGTRTFHRLACAIEDAGWEIRDTVMWVYGSGFPKSLDVSKAIDKSIGVGLPLFGLEKLERTVVSEGKPVRRMIPGADQNETGSWIKDNGREYVPTITKPATAQGEQWEGWGTALKPAWEPIILARKPLSEPTVAANVLKWGTGALNIDGCRVPAKDGVPKFINRAEPAANCYSDGLKGSNRTGEMDTDTGRWPANLIHDGSEEVLQRFPIQESGANPTRRGSPKFRNTYAEFEGQEECEAARGADAGSAARFFYCAKADNEDRGEGNTHPTVKPRELMKYLCRLVAPLGGTILDPFCGSGSTGLAASVQGFHFAGVELSTDYCAMTVRRWQKEQPTLPLTMDAAADALSALEAESAS